MRPGLGAQVLRFSLVGVLNTVTYFACYLLLVRVLPYLTAHVLAFAVSLTGSFLLNCRFTYRVRPTWRKFLVYPLTAVANFVITTVGVVLLVELLAVDQRPAPLIAAVAAIPLTFLATRTLLVGRPRALPSPGVPPLP